MTQELFQEAVGAGDTKQVHKLLTDSRLAKLLDLDSFDREGMTALHHFCLSGDLELVKLLVKSGANARLANRDGWGPVHLAAYGGHSEIALFLMKATRRHAT
uniref:Notch-regulated ankyrin repeat protein Nrarp n=1 Tax=Platynereis dumerilii TaxID=6359 RepID=A0A1C6ZZW4_PLADU|nr:notch-regulated ankyrin repeat protein Nrarp [Platynereis dumerilii]